MDPEDVVAAGGAPARANGGVFGAPSPAGCGWGDASNVAQKVPALSLPWLATAPPPAASVAPWGRGGVASHGAERESMLWNDITSFGCHTSGCGDDVHAAAGASALALAAPAVEDGAAGCSGGALEDAGAAIIII